MCIAIIGLVGLTFELSKDNKMLREELETSRKLVDIACTAARLEKKMSDRISKMK